MLPEYEIPEMPEFPEEENPVEEATPQETNTTPSPETEEETLEQSSPSEDSESPEIETDVVMEESSEEENQEAPSNEENVEESPQKEEEPQEEVVEQTPEAQEGTNTSEEEEKGTEEETGTDAEAETETKEPETAVVAEEAATDKEEEEEEEEEEKAEEEKAEEEKPEQPSPKSPPTPPAPEVEQIPANLSEGVWDKMKEILSGEKSNQQILSNANLDDLLVLLEHFTQDQRILRHIPRVGLVKRTFDALKYNQEFSEEQLSLFQDKLGAFNRNRVEAQKVVEDQKKENAKIKAELLANLKEIVASQDPLRIKEVREIQDQWREIGQVPRDQMDTLYREYRAALDDFYKRRELHFEMLEYDRRKNLQDKERLIEEAKNLIPPEDQREDTNIWKEKMDALTELQQQWKSVGHVPREEMERINNDYRSTIDQFFEVRSIFLGKLDEERGENAQMKEELLTEMAKFSDFNAERPKEWNEATRELKSYQDKWKEIGQAAYAINNDLWNRYRAICDAFFAHKAEFFKKFDEFRAENLVKKRALCERAEELASSQEWEKSARELKQLQKDWKAIGPVPERHSNKLWNRFRAACDAFFEGRRTHYQKMHEGEYANLDSKKALIEEVKKLTEEQNQNIEEAIERVKSIQKEWKEIGKVPYKEKDKIWEVFRKQVDDFFNGLSAKRSQMRDMSMNAKLDDIHDDRQRSNAIKERIRNLRRRIGKSQEQVDQYSTNIEFISKGKSGDALRAQIQKSIDDEKAKIDEWKKKIKELNEMAKNPPKKKEEPKEEAQPKEVAEPTPSDEATQEQEAANTEAEAVVAETAETETPVEEASPEPENESTASEEAEATTDAEGGDESGSGAEEEG